MPSRKEKRDRRNSAVISENARILAGLGPCPICGRALEKGPSIDRHHWIPKSFGGQDWSWMHVVCHRKLHSLFTEKDMANRYHSPTNILSHPDMRAFIAWVKDKPPEFTSGHKRQRR